MCQIASFCDLPTGWDRIHSRHHAYKETLGDPTPVPAAASTMVHYVPFFLTTKFGGVRYPAQAQRARAKEKTELMNAATVGIPLTSARVRPKEDYKRQGWPLVSFQIMAKK